MGRRRGVFIVDEVCRKRECVGIKNGAVGQG